LRIIPVRELLTYFQYSHGFYLFHSRRIKTDKGQN
jgi:hypothetical protein